MKPAPKRDPKILLVNAPHFRLFSPGVSYLQLGILSMAAVLRESGFDVSVYDPDFDPGFVRKSAYNIGYPPGYKEAYAKNLHDRAHPVWKDVRRTIGRADPDVVGISFTTFDCDSASEVAAIAKGINGDAVTVVGGHHVNALPGDAMRERLFDFGVLGEGELTMLELAKALRSGGRTDKIKGLAFRKGGRVRTTGRMPMIKDLDSLPFPARDLLLDAGKYPPHVMGSMITSRGCPYECGFCTTPPMYGRAIRMRSAENVFAEMKQVKSEFGTSFFTFHDDVCTFDRKRMSDLCDLIRKGRLDVMWTCVTRADLLDRGLVEKMKSAGCFGISIGAESGSQAILDSIPKRTDIGTLARTSEMVRGAGMNLHLFFTVGHADETEASMDETDRMIDELCPTTLNVSRVIPFPGTRTYYEAVKDGRFVRRNWHDYRMKLRNIGEAAFMKRLLGMRAQAHRKNLSGIRRTVADPRFIARYSKENIRSPRELLMYATEFIKTQLSAQ